MTATSSYDALHAARDARLGNNTSAWCASNSTLDQYLQVTYTYYIGYIGNNTLSTWNT